MPNPPSLKLATDTMLWDRQQEDIDINCGGVIDGHRSHEEVGANIFTVVWTAHRARGSSSELHGSGRTSLSPGRRTMIHISIGALPTSQTGYAPSGGVGLIVMILIILLLMGRLYKP